MQSTCSESARSNGAWKRVAALALAAMLGSCAFTDAPAFPRPELTMSQEARDTFALPGPVQLLKIEPVGSGGTFIGDLACGNETVHFHLYEHEKKDAPLVLLVPILGGGEELLRTMARRFVQRGYHAIYCDRAGSALRPPQRGPELEKLLVRTVLHQRIALRWARNCDQLRPQSTFACGVSMGGIVTTLLTALEPSLEGSAMCLAGADLPTILSNSAEPRIQKWRDWRLATDGISGTPLDQELRQNLRSDPLRFAPYVRTDRVFLVAAEFDEVVRPHHQDLLWEALGRPQRLSIPLGHYSAAICLDPLVSSIADFFDARQRDSSLAVAANVR
jgi:pimeloyl-ACP methyl ester carboxylesterase